MTKNDHFCLLHGLVPRLSARSRPRNMRQKLPFLVLFDATGGLFWANWLFGDFWPFLGVKNGYFGRKWPYFEIFRILLMSASASLCSSNRSFGDIIWMKTNFGKIFLKIRAARKEWHFQILGRNLGRNFFQKKNFFFSPCSKMK